jgi:hypothetical protein
MTRGGLRGDVLPSGGDRSRELEREHMAAHPPETNPYSPPRERRASREKRRPEQPAPGERIKWIYAVVAAVNAVALLSIAFGVASAAGIQQELITLVDGPLRLVPLALAPLWIYYAWSGIPRELRRGVTPGGAIVGLIVPFFSIYWIFAVNVRLCNCVDSLLSRIDDRRRAPKTLAIVATVIYFVPLAMMLAEASRYTFLVLIAEHVLWFVYMLQCDELRRAVIAVGSQPRPSDAAASAAERDEYDEKLDRELGALDDR